MPPKTPANAKGKGKPKESTPVASSDESGSGSESESASTPPVKQKAAKAKAPVTPAKRAGAPPPTSAKKATPAKKKKAVAPFKRLAEEGEASVPVNASFEGEALQAKQLGKGYEHLVKFQASRPFALHKTVFLTNGPYAGYQAVLLKPAAPFNFAGLPQVVRKLIYEYYFASRGVVGGPIIVEAQRVIEGKKDRFAKAYGAGDRNRVALLAVSKDINHVAGQIFHDITLRFENTQTLNDFLLQLNNSVERLRSIHIGGWTKNYAKNAMMGLVPAKHLRELKIETGVGVDADPVKAAKVFYELSYKLLQALGEKDNKAAGVDKLKFGKQAFTFLDKKDVKKPWDQELVSQFKDNLKAKLKSLALQSWVCVCGSLVAGHTCGLGLIEGKTERAKRIKAAVAEKTSWAHIGHGGQEILLAGG